MLTIKKLRYKNFRSAGNDFIEVDFTRAKSTLVVGENGAGKSTMNSALSLAFYNKALEKINKPDLINTMIGKGALVEVDFETDKHEYMVRRGIKPGVFEVYEDGEMIDQDAAVGDLQEWLEKSVLRMNHKSFLQIVILGSANYVPFMRLPAGDRRKVIEDLLDIQVFSTMNSLLSDRVKENRDAVSSLEKDAAVIEAELAGEIRRLESLRESDEARISDLASEGKRLSAEIAAEKKAIEELNSQIEELESAIGDADEVAKRASELATVRRPVASVVRQLETELEFFRCNDECPTCKQGMTHLKETVVLEKESVLEAKSAELAAIDREIGEVSRRNTEISQVRKRASELERSRSHHETKVATTRKFVASIRDQITRLKSEKKESADDSTARELESRLESVKEARREAIRQREVLGAASVLLKDGGIKARVVRQYVPVINKLIAKYLAELDFFVGFELDENFDEKITSRHRDSFSYEMFSEGEKMRIDLALLFTWRALAKMRSSASTNLLIMDEIFESSLDGRGADEFMKMIRSLTSDTNVVIISHRGDQLFDKFDSVIRFRKERNFSQMEVV